MTRLAGTSPIVVAYGMGVDSTAMLIGLRARRVPIELMLFADTGSEKPETMANLPIVQRWLAAQSMPPVTVIKRHSPRAGDTSLHAECLRKRVLPSLAYGGHSCSRYIYRGNVRCVCSSSTGLLNTRFSALCPLRVSRMVAEKP